jgi:hypothetical protein
MAKVLMKSLTKSVSPKGGKAMWCKINSRVDEYEGKKKYTVSVVFDDKKTEAAFKKYCDDTFAEAKELPEFADKRWRAGNDRCGYDEKDDGTIEFKFQTQAYTTDKNTGEEIKRHVPIVNTQTRKTIPDTVSIGNGSEIRVAFTPSVYWMTKESNGMNLYINKVAVDKLIEYGGGNDFSEFGIELDDFAADDEEDIPV